jgi:hypothetical protein
VALEVEKHQRNLITRGVCYETRLKRAERGVADLEED